MWARALMRRSARVALVLLLGLIGSTSGCRRDARYVEERYFYGPSAQADALAKLVLQFDGARRRAGLPAGTVLERIEGAEDLPLAIYSVRLADEQDVAKALASDQAPEVLAVLSALGSLAGKSAHARWHLIRDEPPSDGRWVSRNWYFAAAGQTDAVLSARLEGSATREAQGIRPGRILAQREGAAQTEVVLPDVVWETTLKSFDAASRAAEDRVTQSPAFQAVLARVRPALSRFEQSWWRRHGGRGD